MINSALAIVTLLSRRRGETSVVHGRRGGTSAAHGGLARGSPPPFTTGTTCRCGCRRPATRALGSLSRRPDHRGRDWPPSALSVCSPSAPSRDLCCWRRALHAGPDVSPTPDVSRSRPARGWSWSRSSTIETTAADRPWHRVNPARLHATASPRSCWILQGWIQASGRAPAAVTAHAPAQMPFAATLPMPTRSIDIA